MASTQVPESVDRDYSDNFSIKEMAKETLVPKYFEGKDVSDLNVGLLGYTTELISDGLEDTFNTVSTLHEEMFPNRAKLPSSILSHAAIFQLSNGMANAASCDFILLMKEQYVIDNFQQENGNNVFYIDKDTKILVEDIVFTLDYDIVIRAIHKEVKRGYIYSAQYVTSSFENSISSIQNPYISINKSSNGFLSLKVTCHQCQRTVEYEDILNNTKINLPSFDITFEKQIAGFDIFYKSSTDPDYSKQLTKLTKYSSPLKTPFCYYSFTDENVLTVFFGNRETYFQPDFNSSVKVVMYLTDGVKGNFDIYEGKDISVITTSERYAYNDNFFITAVVMSPSVGGTDTASMEELQALTVESYRTGTIYATDNDLMEYFNNYKYRYGNECLFIKKRDDVIDRLYSGFLIMRKDDYIFPTNTLYLDCNLDEMVNSDGANKFILDPGCLFTYNKDGNIVIYKNSDKLAEYQAVYETYCADNGKDMHQYSLYKYMRDNDLSTSYTIFDYDDVSTIAENEGFVYTNPFLIACTKSPNLVGMYLTIVNQNVAVDFIGQNLTVFDQFIITNLKVNRKLEKQKKYTLTTSLMPAASLSSDDDIIQEDSFGDITKTVNNLVRVVAVLEDSDGENLCYTELVPIEKTTSGNYTFEGTFETDDHVTSANKFRITKGITAMDNLEDMLVPMTTVVNIYVLYKGDNITTDNIFSKYDESFNDYAWTNIYSTDNEKIVFIKPLNMIKSELTFKDYRISGNSVNDCKISSIPLLGAELISNAVKAQEKNELDRNSEDEMYMDRFEYFVQTYQDQYLNMEKTIDFLKTSTHIDLKFYNTYGKSKNFIIGDEVDGEELIDTINIKVKYYIWVTPGTDQINAEKTLKQYIKDYIESINSDGTNNFYNSNMMKTIENKFAYVHHCKFIGINHYEPKYQAVKNVTVDLNDLDKDERIKYVPEVLVANLENIELTFFEA